MPAIAVVVPALNEAGGIDACLRSLLAQDYGGQFDITVMDGGSTDATAELVRRWVENDPRVRLRANPARLQGAAVNLAAVTAGAAVLVRADAHAVYPPGFLRLLVAALGERRATSVVVPMRTAGAAGFAVAVAAVQNSRLGHGGSAHRSAGASRWVDHGHHAAFDLGFFRSLGGYDERFSHNEDAELDLRAVAAGGRVWLCAEAGIDYVPRGTLGGLVRQYARHGVGRARTLLLHRRRPRLRQLLPVAILAGCAGGVAGAVLLSPWLVAAPAGYALICCAWGAVMAVQCGDARLLGMGPAAMAMHLSWGWGFLRTVMTARPGLPGWRGAAPGLPHR